MQRSATGGRDVKIIGIVLIALGVFVLVSGGIRYTDRDTIVKVGPIEAQTEERKTLPFSPALGAAAIAAGVALIVVDVRRRPRARA